MRVLHLTPELPRWPGGSGGATRQFHLLRRLVQLGHEVTVVAPVAAAEEPGAEALAGAGIRLEATRRPESRLREGLAVVGREPSLVARAATLPVLAWQVAVFWARLRPIARRVAATWGPDVITVEHDNAASWGPDLTDAAPAVLTLHNLGWRYYESRAGAAAGLAGPALRLEARRFRRHDMRWLGRYRMLIAVSELDRMALEPTTGVPVKVVPNGVASEEIRPQDDADEPPRVLFTGTMSHPPNEEGILWFAREVWPRVRASYPDAELMVVGRSPSPPVRALAAEPGIEVPGAVPEMLPWFARATVVVVPLMSGGGTRLKVLEALSAARAVVSTPVGVEGLEVRDGRDLIVEASAERFAEAVVRLLGDGELRRRLARAGRQTAEERYDWRVLGDRLAALLEEARTQA